METTIRASVGLGDVEGFGIHETYISMAQLQCGPEPLNNEYLQSLRGGYRIPNLQTNTPQNLMSSSLNSLQGLYRGLDTGVL